MEHSEKRRTVRSGWSRAEEELLLKEAGDVRAEGLPLKVAFDRVATATGRKANSIRNYYYARIKAEGRVDESLKSAAFVPFTREEERSLLRTVLSAQANGISVRACTLALGEGDTRRMLRYQNKYRSLIKAAPDLVRAVMAELCAEGLAVRDPYLSRDERAATARFGRLDAAAFFEALEALAAKYRKMIM